MFAGMEPICQSTNTNKITGSILSELSQLIIESYMYDKQTLFLDGMQTDYKKNLIRAASQLSE